MRRTIAIATAAALFSLNAAYAEPAAPSPAIKNSNPASSSTSDDDGNNPMARAGENSPTGQGPSAATNPPTHGTVGSGPANQAAEQRPNQTTR